ncbi:MAG: hypothetical protein LH603_13060, partial [Pseudonocardia sp.]|nr:hypothetical protein [Pseudonocardia sp.]
MVSTDRSPNLTNPYRNWAASAAECEPGSLRSSQARALLAGGVAAGLTTAGMLLGAGGALADDVSDAPDTSERSSSSTTHGSESTD